MLATERIGRSVREERKERGGDKDKRERGGGLGREENYLLFLMSSMMFRKIY